MGGFQQFGTLQRLYVDLHCISDIPEAWNQRFFKQFGTFSKKKNALEKSCRHFETQIVQPKYMKSR